METKNNNEHNNNKDSFRDDQFLMRGDMEAYKQEFLSRTDKTIFKIDRESDLPIVISQEELENAQYTKEEISRMRANNDNRLYQSLACVKGSSGWGSGCVWENGKVGYFNKVDKAGLEFIQADKNTGQMWSTTNNPICISGFGFYLLMHWGEDFLKLCEDYTAKGHEKLVSRLKAQLQQDCYPDRVGDQTIDNRAIAELYREIKSSEQRRWEQATISEFFSPADNERLNKCMSRFFTWVDEQISRYNSIGSENQTDCPPQPQAAEAPPKSADEPQQYSDRFDIAKVQTVYDFCIDTKVLDRDVISNIDFINAVNSADFKTIHDHAEIKKSKSKCKYIIHVLSKFINDKSWYLRTAHSINTEPSRCSGTNVPMDWKTQADAIR